MVKCAELLKTEFFMEDLDGIMHMIRKETGGVGVGSDRQDLSTEVFIQSPDIAARLNVVESVMPGRRVQFNALAVTDRQFQDLSNLITAVFKRIAAGRIVADQKIQVSQHAVILIFLHDIIDFLIILFVVFLLASAALEILGPEFLIVHLMHGKQNKSQAVSGTDRE